MSLLIKKPGELCTIWAITNNIKGEPIYPQDGDVRYWATYIDPNTNLPVWLKDSNNNDIKNIPLVKADLDDITAIDCFWYHKFTINLNTPYNIEIALIFKTILDTILVVAGTGVITIRADESRRPIAEFNR